MDDQKALRSQEEFSMLDTINLWGVLAAAVIAFIFGALWYGVLGKAWMKAAGLTREETRPNPKIFIVAFICQILMAFVLAGVIFHTGETTLKTGLISAVLIWLGFVVTTQIVNHRFQGAPWALTLIDGGHWLGVLLIQGAVIGVIGQAS
jgi:glycerol uptake facilitator-like aquaporin